MCPSSNTLNVSSGPLAEISVLDGSMNTVAQSVGGLTKDLAPGLYKVRVRNGPAIQEELVSLDTNRSIDVKTPPIYSPIPLADTTRTHEYHMARAATASRTPRFAFGQGSGLFVFCREWTPSGSGTGRNPARGLSIADESGSSLSDLERDATFETSEDASAAWCAQVAPGSYRIRLTSANGGVTERALYASPNCQTQLFVLLPQPKSESDAADSPDLIGGAAIISPSNSFDPEDRQTQLGEIARYALAQKRRVLTDELRQEIVNQKFDDPMLGLLGAHLVLRDEPENTRLFDTVTLNLLRLLGPDHPDLRVLCLHRSAPLPQVPRSLDTPPMLRASWDLAVAASLTDSNSFPEAGGVLQIASKVVSTGAWLVWRQEAEEEGVGSPGSGASSALQQSLEDFLAARARLDAARLTSSQSVLGHISSSVRTALSTGINRVRGIPSSPPPKSSVPPLNADDRAELAKVLGVPAPLLDSLLKRISDK